MTTAATFTIEQQQELAHAILELFMIAGRTYPQEHYREIFKGTANSMFRELAYQTDQGVRDGGNEGQFANIDVNASMSEYVFFVQRLEELADVIGDGDILAAALRVDPRKGYRTEKMAEESMVNDEQVAAVDVLEALRLSDAVLRTALSLSDARGESCQTLHDRMERMKNANDLLRSTSGEGRTSSKAREAVRA